MRKVRLWQRLRTFGWRSSRAGWLYNDMNDISTKFLFPHCPSGGWHYVWTLSLSWNTWKVWNALKDLFPNRFWPKARNRKCIFRDFFLVSKSGLHRKRDSFHPAYVCYSEHLGFFTFNLWIFWFLIVFYSCSICTKLLQCSF